MAGDSILSARKEIERGKFESVYYLTGDEEILKDEFVDIVVDKAVDPGSRDFNVDLRSAGDLNAESILTLVDTPPMLAERRVAVIRNLEAWRKNSKPWKAVYQYVESPSPTSVVILVHGPGQDADTKLVQHSRHFVADAPEAEPRLAWIKERGQRCGITLTDDATNHLIASVGGNLSQIAVELDKLSAASNTDTIQVTDVETLVGVRHGETLPDWINAIMQKDFGRAVTLVDIILAQPGMSAVKMLMTLGTGLVGVQLARAHLDRGQPASHTRRAVFEELRRARPMGIGRYGEEVDRWMKAVKRWSAAELDEAVRRAYDADNQIKSTTIKDPREILYTMLLYLAAKETS